MILIRQRRLIFRLALSLALVGVLVWRVNISEALELFAEVNYLYVLGALPVYTLSKLVDAARWRLMIRPIGNAPVPGLLGALLVANMTNNVLPVRLGDVMRVQIPAQRYGLPRAGLTATVFVTESLLDGVAFVALTLVGVALLDIPNLPLGLVWLLMALVAVGLVMAGLVARLRLSEGWEERGWMRYVAPKVREAAAGLVPQFISGLAVLRDPALAARAMVLTLAAWGLEALMFWLFGLAFGLDLSFSAYLVIMVAANMIVSMPVAPSNIGPYELATAEVVAVLGVARPLAGAYAIGTHLLNILWVGISGLIAMWLMGLSFEDIFSLKRPEGPQPEPVSETP